MSNGNGPRNDITWAYLFCYIVGIGGVLGAIAAIDRSDFRGVGMCLLAAAVAFGAIVLAANRR